MDQEAALKNMKKFGFSEYESKAYLKLLEDYPMNGYALSKHSGIPRSRIYEVLKNLMEKHVVFEQVEEKNTLYYPVEPQEFFKKLKSDYDNAFLDISEFTEKVYKKQEKDEKLVVIKGRKSIFEFVNLLIRGAERRIALSVWEEDVHDLLVELEKAMERGVLVSGIYFGDASPCKTLVPHRRIKRYRAEKKQRYIAIIIDSTHALSGIVSKGDLSKATWTKEEGFIEISEDFIAHDLVINLYSASLDKEEYEKFENFSENVYRNYYHYSDEESREYKKLL